MALHFSSERPEDQFYTDFGNLNKFGNDAFSQLNTLVFNFLNDPQQSGQFLAQLEEFAAQNSFGLAALKNLVKTILVVTPQKYLDMANFFKAALKKNLSPGYVKEDLVQLGLSEEKATWIASKWKANLASMSRVAAGQSLTVNQLVDMEWKFGVTAADSDVKKIGNTFLQLKLVLSKGVGTEEVFMELTLPQFYTFLHQMEKAKSSLEYFG